MADSRTKNATRNIASGMTNQLATMVLGFLSRTAILYLLGANYLGVGTLFSAVLNFLSLTELGVSSAIVFAMYKPVAENDYDTINAILAYYRKLYIIIGTVILTIGTIIVPAIPFLISGDSPAGVNIYVLYYLYLINAVISYFFAGYKQSVLVAFQRMDISKAVATFTNILLQVLQIGILYATKNFYAYAIVPIFCTILMNAINAHVVNHKFPQIKPKGTVSDETKKAFKSRLSGLFGTKLNSVVVHQADTIVISAFLGLTAAGVYGNYYYVFNAVSSIVIMVYTAVVASVGNKLVKDKIEENYVLFKRMEFVNAWIVCLCCTCFFCLYEPFEKIWAGADLCLGQGFAGLMTAYFYVYQIQRTILTFKDAAGIWREDRNRPYVAMVFNLSCNLILIHLIGIYGVVVSTILSFLISLPWANKVLHKNLFQCKSGSNLLFIAKYAAITALACACSFCICDLCPEGLLGLVIRLVVCGVVGNVIFILFSYKSKEFVFCVGLLKKRRRS